MPSSSARLAEKREKLRLMREQKALRNAERKQQQAARAAAAASEAARAENAAAGPSASTTATLNATNVDKLVEDLLEAPAPKLVQEAGVSYSNESNVGSTSSGGATQLSTIASMTLDERLKSLKVCSQVSEVHIVSQAAEKYDKGTQTDGDPEWNVVASPKSPKGPSSPHFRGRARGHSTMSTTSMGDLSHDDNGAAVDADESGSGDDGDADGDGDNKENKVSQLKPEEINNIMGTRSFDDFFQKTVRVTERALLANTKFDVLVEYGETSSGGLDDGADKMSTNFDFFNDRWCTGRSITKLAWSINNPELLLGCYSAPSGASAVSDLEWTAAKSDPDGLLAVWNLMNQAAPEYVFTAQSPVLTGMFHPFSHNLLLGSTYSGQICLWDIRARRSPIQKTQLSAAGHTHPVYSMQVVGTQNAHNLVTISTNGKLCVWDTTQLVTPTETIVLKMESTSGSRDSGDSTVAVTTSAFAHGETNSFYVGAETGSLYGVEMHGSQPGVQRSHKAHHALVSNMQFHPQTDVRGSASDVLLTSSFDWTLKLWNLKRSPDRPLHTFTASSDYIFDAQWSPVHPSVLASGDGSGNVDLWDLCIDMEVPIHRVEGKGKIAVSSLAWHSSGNQLAAGFSDGHISMLDVNPSVAQPGPKAHSAFVELLSGLPAEDYSAEGRTKEDY